MWKEMRKSTLIHFDKLVILYSLVASLYQADVFRMTYLVFFIIYAFVDLLARKRYMRIHLSLTYIMLFILYIIELVFIRNLFTLHSAATTFGMDDFNLTNPEMPFVFIYQFYDIIFACILLSFQIQVVYKTQILIKYKKHIIKIEEVVDDHQQQLLNIP